MIVRKKNKLRQEFLSNLIGLSSVNILNLLIPIVTMPLLSRTLGSTGYGIVLLMSSVYIFMVVIVDYSVNINGVREAAKQENSLDCVYNKYQGVRLILSLMYLPIAIIYCYYNIPSLSILNIFELMTISSLGYYLMAPWFHQGTSTLMFFSFAAVAIRLMQVALIVIFIQKDSDLLLMLRLNAYTFILNGIVLYFYRKSKFSLHFSLKNKINFSEFKKGFGNFIGDFSPNLYSNLPPLLLGGLVSPHIFACYALALRLINVSGSFQSILCRSIYPIASKKRIDIIAFMGSNVIVSLIPIGILFFFSDQLITWFLGNGYSEAALFLKIGSIAILTYSISNSLLYGFFLPCNYDKYFRNISLASSIIPALIGYPLIYFWGALGAMLMFVFARTSFATLYFYYFIKLRKHE